MRYVWWCRNRMQGWSAPVVLVLLLSCASPVDPFPRDAEPFTPSAEYLDYWHEVEHCSGLTGDFSAVRWYTVPDSVISVRGTPDLFDAYWFRAGNRIVFAHDVLPDVGLVQHEMLHALLHSGAHPCLYFISRCGPYVKAPRDCT